MEKDQVREYFKQNAHKSMDPDGIHSWGHFQQSLINHINREKYPKTGGK